MLRLLPYTVPCRQWRDSGADKRAAGEQKVAVNYRGQINVQQATQLPEFLNAYEYALLYNRAVENSGTGTAYTPEQLDMIRNHSNPNVYGDSDLMDYLDNVGYTTTHSVSVNGGNQLREILHHRWIHPFQRLV